MTIRNEIKTIRGYVSAIRRIAAQSLDIMKGYGELPDQDKETIKFFTGEVCSCYEELAYLDVNRSKKVMQNYKQKP